MKTILIFGGYGFVGNNLYKFLIKKNYKVYRYTSQKKKLKNHTLNILKKIL
tara:strand:+ start:326 stop:478 length:153 start_codon:yes stop_codon:yes gene_type:complete